ncbi:hypothetical protein N0V84_000674 [Fusarium piperis]|uniref:Azaphilone pigments biosynthesis cluster protein L N-terminal domain-containing protein n=1 Tax=Fusarium piperis TaxID=1435070 RepID=A0A9W8WMS4_9HYPO|nr:hypothetical protein N0V84_000674 [Fusarium piperis]
MDPLSTGASIVTFVGLAISITKVVHEGLSTIKDGPQVVRHLRDEFAQLRNILERLSRIPMSISDAAELDGLVKKCSEDVADFEAKILRLDASDTDGRRCRAWRKLKAYFTERDLEEMRHVVRGHIQQLTLWFDLLHFEQGSSSKELSIKILDVVQSLSRDAAPPRQADAVQSAGQYSTPRRPVELGTADRMCGPDHKISRLMLLLNEKPSVIESDDAQQLVGDLEHLLRSVRRDAATKGVSDQRRRKPHGNLTSGRDISMREFTAKLVFKPKNAPTMLTVSVNQGQFLFDSFTSMLPQVTVNSILPRDSLVFQLASSGSVQELMALVAEGKASLHDHDADGRSLLHHSTKNLSMCKFLVEQGLDVNELCGSNLTPLQYLQFAQSDPETIQCLLIAGADPTLTSPHFQSFFGNASIQTDARGDFVLRRMFSISPFVRYADREALECSPFLICCTTPFQRPCSDDEAERCLSRLQFLLSQGYSVHDKFSDGTNSVSNIIRYAENQQYCKAQKDILVFLLNRGADVHSPDIKGRCVTSFAYNKVFCTKCRDVYPPYMGDLWDSVLDECGYEVLEFRKTCPRRAHYTELYTRQVFEQLWQGKEGRCPYWDDKPWPEAPEHVQEDWVFLDRAGRVCVRCQLCFEEHFYGHGSFCGTCGFCVSILGCQCAQDGIYGHKKTCERPLRRPFEWDEENRRFYFVQDGGSSAQDVLDDHKPFDDASIDNGVTSVDLSPKGDGQEHQPLVVNPEEDHDWNTFSPTSSDSSQYPVVSLPELFENPWGRD